MADLQSCALQTPEMALTILETSLTNPEFEGADLTIWLGEPPEGIRGYAAALGSDEIIIVAGSSVGLNQIDAAGLAERYQSGDDLYHLWTYAEGSDLREIFEREILQGAATNPEVRLAPHPQAMLAAIAADPLAIGYLPKAWINGEVKTLPLDVPIEVPIIGITSAEPSGAIKNFLVCLQQRNG